MKYVGFAVMKLREHIPVGKTMCAVPIKLYADEAAAEAQRNGDDRYVVVRVGMR